MLTLKKTMIILSSLTSGIVFAGTMGPVCSPEQVTIPCDARAWDIGIDALYLKAIYNENDAFAGSTSQYTETSNTNLEIISESTRLIETPTQWGTGFKLHGAYRFLTGKEVSLNWSHYNKTGAINKNLNPGLTNFSNVPTHTKAKPQWDAVNLELIQHADLGQRSHLQYHGGLQYVRIKSSFNKVQLSPSPSIQTSPATLHSKDSSLSKTYNGFGPRLGADFIYDLPRAFGIYARGATGLLIGSQKTKLLLQSTTTTLNDNKTLIVTQQTEGSNSALVPELEASLGLTYAQPMLMGNLTLNVGYMWLNYFNASNFINGSSTDFALHGVNFGVKWLG